MKKLVVIFISVTFNFTAQKQYQTAYDNLDSIEFYFVQALDAYRKQTYSEIPFLIISDTLSKAADHHTRYLLNMLSADETRGIISHGEKQTSLELRYHGFDTLIDDPVDRVSYYDVSGTFVISGEVVHCRGTYEDVFKFITQKEMAIKLLQSFLNSPGHKEILDLYGYTHIGISVVRSKIQHQLYICVLPASLFSSKYLNPGSIFPFYYGNKLQDITQ
jgi:uncharacterized protein YkwD